MNVTLEKLRKEKPLILNITNHVTMDFIANGLLSLGASPLMSMAKEEIKDLMKITQAVVINLGTLNKDFMLLAHHVCEIANQVQKPVVLDPVGAGASHYRTLQSQQLLENHDIAIVRGNASEIMALTNEQMITKGVESTVQGESAVQSAKLIAEKFNTVVVVSGKKDIIVDAENISVSEGGSACMPMVTGTGCLLTAVIAAFHAVEKNRFDAAMSAVEFYSVCAEVAEKKSQQPGSFRVEFLNALKYPLSLTLSPKGERG